MRCRSHRRRYAGGCSAEGVDGRLVGLLERCEFSLPVSEELVDAGRHAVEHGAAFAGLLLEDHEPLGRLLGVEGAGPRGEVSGLLGEVAGGSLELAHGFRRRRHDRMIGHRGQEHPVAWRGVVVADPHRCGGVHEQNHLVFLLPLLLQVEHRLQEDSHERE